MAQKFETIEELQDYVDFLEMKGREIPQWVLDEKERLERESAVTEDEFIFSTMKAYNKYMTPEKEKVIRDMTDQLLIEGPQATQPCLLLGKVQCGKTDTFESIMGLCFDKGIDIAIVMTKGTQTLTDQTIKRLEHDFRFFEDKETYNQKVIVKIWNILQLFRRGGLSDNDLNDPAKKFIIVVKKETTNLTYLKELFEINEQMRSKKILICDDEADFASRAYYQKKGEMSLLKIGELIDEVLKYPKYYRYLQITATPYSLYLQPDGTIHLRDGEEATQWLPRYTGLVPIHDMYIGGKQYFELSEDENSMYSCLYQPVPQICRNILSARNEWYKEQASHSENLHSLNYAIVSYMFATAVRSIQERKKTGKKYKSSCLIHCEISKENHRWQEDLINNIIDDITKAFLDKGNTDLHILDMESQAYDSLRSSNELGNAEGLISEKFPTFGEIEAEVKRLLENNSCAVSVINSEDPEKTKALRDPKTGQLLLDRRMNIFIGGSILDRGITIDNMLCFFYGRDPKKFQMDTVLQHARMYGARAKEDMACTRFFTTEDIYDVLKTINDIDSMMYDYLKAHRTTVQSNDFTSMVIGYDNRIKATAANKFTPSNTTIIKAKRNILPIAFQTGDKSEIEATIKEIDELIAASPDYPNRTDDNPFFLMDYETAAKIIKLIASTFRYSEEWENMDWLWDANEMLTTLEHCTFGTDGYIYCLVRTNRNMSREREKKLPNKRWSDAPYDGRNDLEPSRRIAIDRPVLMLLRQNGQKAKGWMDTPFYWPVFRTQDNVREGIFTINSNKKFRAPNKQFKLAAYTKYPLDEMLILTVNKGPLFDFILGVRNNESREIKRTNCSLFLDRGIDGNYMLVEGTEEGKYYDLSTYNNGVFPFEIRKFKYLYLRNSQDFSGSQAFVELDKEKPYSLWAEKIIQTDVLYDSMNEGSDVEDDDTCLWSIDLFFNKVLEYKLTPQDEDLIKQYKEELEAMAEAGEPTNE